MRAVDIIQKKRDGGVLTPAEIRFFVAGVTDFSLPDYQDYASRLKTEWETNLNLFYTDVEWDELNLNMLSAHIYFTDYGKNILQQKKALNIVKLKSRFE